MNESVKKYQRKIFFTRVLKFFIPVSLIAAAVFYIIKNGYLEKASSVSFFQIILLISFTVIVYYSGIHKIFYEKNIKGTVSGTKIRHYYAPEVKKAFGGSKILIKESLSVLIEKNNGDIFELRLYDNEENFAFYRNYYKNGDRVILFKTVKYPLRLEKKEKYSVCVFCGYINEANKKNCGRCGGTVVNE